MVEARAFKVLLTLRAEDRITPTLCSPLVFNEQLRPERCPSAGPAPPQAPQARAQALGGQRFGSGLFPPCPGTGIDNLKRLRVGITSVSSRFPLCLFP